MRFYFKNHIIDFIKKKIYSKREIRNNSFRNYLNKDFNNIDSKTKEFEKLKIILSIFNHLSTKRKKQLIILFLIMLMTGILETFSLFSIIPVLLTINGSSKIRNIPIFQTISDRYSIEPNTFFIYACIFLILISLISTFTKILNLWISERLSAAIGSDISCRVFDLILNQPYNYHLNINSSKLIASTTAHIDGLVVVLRSLLRLFTSLLIVIFLLIGLISISFRIAISTTFIFSITYVFFSAFSKRKLYGYSKSHVKNINLQIKSLQEGLGSIRDVILTNSQETFLKKYRKADFPMRIALAKSNFLGLSPKYILECLGIILIILLILFLNLSSRPNDLGIIPIVGTIALGAQKLLPAMQQSYNSWAILGYNFLSIIEILTLLNLNSNKNNQKLIKSNINIFSNNLKFDKIEFTYDKSTTNVLKNINFTILPGERIGVIGKTGSGKSTLINILMGLLEPTQGSVLIDNQNLYKNPNREFLYNWRRQIGHVPQQIFLTDGSIAENIAFGESNQEINFDRVIESAKKAQISDYIELTNDGYNTIVGERGIKLSGGQIQRIGIARALYRNCRILIFDEATSALDNDTEKALIKAINNISKDITLITIAHRLSTVANCDRLILVDKGKIQTQGIPSTVLSQMNIESST